MKYKLYILVLLLVAPVFSYSQENFVSLHIKNGVLLNHKDHNTLTSDVNTIVKNTFQQSIGINFTRLTKHNLILSGGVDLGYEQYKADVNYPFDKYGFIRPAQLNEKYELNATIPFAEINLNIGYRFNKIKKIAPEVKLGQVLHLPFKYKDLYYFSQENSVTGLTDNNFTSRGHYGKITNGFVGELFNYVYVGVNMPVNMGSVEKITAGIQFQSQFIFRDNPFNTFEITYYDAFGFTRSVEEFKGTHSSISLIIGFTF